MERAAWGGVGVLDGFIYHTHTHTHKEGEGERENAAKTAVGFNFLMSLPIPTAYDCFGSMSGCLLIVIITFTQSHLQRQSLSSKFFCTEASFMNCLYHALCCAEPVL